MIMQRFYQTKQPNHTVFEHKGPQIALNYSQMFLAETNVKKRVKMCMKTSEQFSYSAYIPHLSAPTSAASLSGQEPFGQTWIPWKPAGNESCSLTQTLQSKKTSLRPWRNSFHRHYLWQEAAELQRALCNFRWSELGPIFLLSLCPRLWQRGTNPPRLPAAAFPAAYLSLIYSHGSCIYCISILDAHAAALSAQRPFRSLMLQVCTFSWRWSDFQSGNNRFGVLLSFWSH